MGDAEVGVLLYKTRDCRNRDLGILRNLAVPYIIVVMPSNNYWFKFSISVSSANTISIPHYALCCQETRCSKKLVVGAQAPAALSLRRHDTDAS